MSTKKIIRQIAKKNGVTSKQVQAEMKEAIRVGMASRDPQANAIWKHLAPDGKEPSIDLVLKFCINRMQTQMMQEKQRINL